MLRYTQYVAAAQSSAPPSRHARVPHLPALRRRPPLPPVGVHCVGRQRCQGGRPEEPFIIVGDGIVPVSAQLRERPHTPAPARVFTTAGRICITHGE